MTQVKWYNFTVGRTHDLVLSPSGDDLFVLGPHLYKVPIGSATIGANATMVSDKIVEQNYARGSRHAVYQDTLYFHGKDADPEITRTDDQRGSEVWMPDGTAVRTRVAFDVNPEPRRGSRPGNIVTTGNGYLFFTVNHLHDYHHPVPAVASLSNNASSDSSGSGSGNDAGAVQLLVQRDQADDDDDREQPLREVFVRDPLIVVGGQVAFLGHTTIEGERKQQWGVVASSRTGDDNNTIDPNATLVWRYQEGSVSDDWRNLDKFLYVIPSSKDYVVVVWQSNWKEDWSIATVKVSGNTIQLDPPSFQHSHKGRRSKNGM